TSISPEKAPDHPGYDVIADVMPAAHQRGIKVICWFEDVFRNDVPGFDKAVEIDLNGKPNSTDCHRNPNTRNFSLGLVEDYLRSYDIEGLRWGSDQKGPLDSALGAKHGQFIPSNTAACFCRYCRDAARRDGINPDRAREGFHELHRLVQAISGGHRPIDGAF